MTEAAEGISKRDLATLRLALRIAIDSEVASVEAHEPQGGQDHWKRARQRSAKNVAAFRALLKRLPR